MALGHGNAWVDAVSRLITGHMRVPLVSLYVNISLTAWQTSPPIVFVG